MSTSVFVHGVPETAAIWDRVRGSIDRPSTALALPGFGTARPDGCAATKDAYVDWLVGELEAIGEPVDLVGHDWGAGLTVRVAQTRPELLRSWVVDVANIIHPDYVWHEFAQMWQTPDLGEAAFAEQLALDVEVRGELLAGLGVDAADARRMAGWLDQTMADCILALYRSATPNLHADWGPLEPVGVPGLVLVAADDLFSDEAMAAAVADLLGAASETFSGGGHFWPFSGTDEAVRILETFWSGVIPGR